MTYEGLELIQLKHDHPHAELNAGDYGVVWGVYGLEPDGPFTYEATFFGADGLGTDMMLSEDEVLAVEDVSVAPIAERLIEARAILDAAERNLAMLSLLRYIRDTSPTEEQLLAWLGPSDHGRYHKLRKAGLTVIQNGHVKLSPSHLSADGKSFLHEVRLYWLDKDQIDTLFISQDGAATP
jgi:hypothetical protein